MPVSAAVIENRPVVPAPAVRSLVKVQVTRKGHGKVSTGRHDVTYGEEFFAHNEEFSVSEDIAEALEDRGFVVVLKVEDKKKAVAE